MLIVIFIFVENYWSLSIFSFVLSVPLIPSYRILLTIAGFIGGICLLVCRNNMNVAVVCMTIDENENSTDISNNSRKSDHSSSVVQLVNSSHLKSQKIKRITWILYWSSKGNTFQVNISLTKCSGLKVWLSCGMTLKQRFRCNLPFYNCL